MLAIWSLVPLPFLTPAWTSGTSRFMYCLSLAWRILSITLRACEMSAIVQLCLSYDQLRQHIKKQTLLRQLRSIYSRLWFFQWSCMDVKVGLKKAECQRIDAFELWCWTRPLRVPWTARRSNQSLLKEISPGYSLEGLMLKLKLQWWMKFQPDAKSWLIWKDPDAGKDWGQ